MRLLGNGLAESLGASSGAAGFPSCLAQAQAVAVRARRRIEVKTLLGAAWGLPALAQQLRDEHL